MAKEGERPLSRTGWLPEPLRFPEPEVPAEAAGTHVAESLAACLDDEDAPTAAISAAAEDRSRGGQSNQSGRPLLFFPSKFQ